MSVWNNFISQHNLCLTEEWLVDDDADDEVDEQLDTNWKEAISANNIVLWKY